MLLRLRNFSALSRSLGAALRAPAAACSRCLHAPASSPLARAGFLRAAPAAPRLLPPAPSLLLRWPCAGASALLARPAALPPPALLGALGATRAYGNHKKWAPRHSMKSRALKQKSTSLKSAHNPKSKVKFKLKSHKGARRRFKQSMATGKFHHWAVGRRHNLAGKSRRRHKLRKRKTITPPSRAMQKTLSRLMPYGNPRLKGR